LIAVVAIFAMVLILVLGLRIVAVEGQRGDAVIALQARIDAFSAMADALGLNGASAQELATFAGDATAIRATLLDLSGNTAVQTAAAEQIAVMQDMLADMAGPDGRIAASAALTSGYRAQLDALARAGLVLDQLVLTLMQEQKTLIMAQFWGVALALLMLGLSLLAIFAGILAWLDKRIVGPVGRMTEVVDRIREGDLTGRAPDDGPKELARLGQHINFMAARRAETEAGLRDALAREARLNATLCRTKMIGALGGWHADLRTGVLSWDRQTSAIFEVDRDTCTGPLTRFVGCIVSEDADQVMRYREAQLAAREPLDFQYRIVTPSGTKWVWERAELVTDQTGEVMGLDGTVQDITTMKEIEAALQAARHDADTTSALLRIAGRTARFGGWRYSVATETVEWTAETAAIHDEPADSQPSLDQLKAFYCPDDRRRLDHAMSDCTRDGKDFNEVLRLQTAKGQQLWVRITGEAVRDQDGRIVEVRGACQDISGLVAARSEADRRNAELEGVIFSLSDGFVMLDENGQIAFYNQCGSKLLGFGPDLRDGANLADYLGGAPQGSFQSELRRLLRQKKPCRTVLRNEDLGGWVEVTIQKIENRKVIVARDVTEERRAQRRLLLLDAALEEIDDIVSIIEVDGTAPKVVYANSALPRITGFAVDDILDQHPGIRFADEPHGQRANLEELDTAIRRGEAASVELVAVKADKTQVWLQVGLFPLHDPNSQRSYVVMIERDITERKLNEERAFHSAKIEAVGQLTGGVAHDFNNLLTVILGNADMLYETLEDEEMRRRVGALIDAAERGARLTDSMLAFSRRTPLRPARTDINQLIEQSHGLLRKAVPENIEITLALDAHHPIAEVDAARLQAAIVNLVLNSRDAIEGHGRITLATADATVGGDDTAEVPGVAAGRHIMVTVSDDGNGVSADVLPHVFEPFFTTKPVGVGTGLGLSTVYGFAKQSGGHVVIHSEPGLGTTVRLYLPCVDGDMHVVPQDRGDAALLIGEGEHVLVVEDDPGLLDYVLKQLRDLNYQVTPASTAEAALDILNQDGCDISVLFTDVVLPGELHGGLLAERALDLRPGLKVLFTSGYPRSALDRHGRIDPEVILLSKPYRLIELAQSLRDVIDA